MKTLKSRIAVLEVEVKNLITECAIKYDTRKFEELYAKEGKLDRLILLESQYLARKERRQQVKKNSNTLLGDIVRKG